MIWNRSGGRRTALIRYANTTFTNMDRKLKLSYGI